MTSSVVKVDVIRTGDGVNSVPVAEMISKVSKIPVNDDLATVSDLTGAPIKTVTSTSYTLLLTDAGKFIEFTSTNPVTVTIPTQASTAFTGAEEYHLCQAGSGKVSVVAASGVALVYPATQVPATTEQHSVCTLKRRAADSWRIFGDMEAAE